MAQAKDKWLDELMLKHANILVLRFSNDKILSQTLAVSAEVAQAILERHGWPRNIQDRLKALITLKRRPMVSL